MPVGEQQQPSWWARHRDDLAAISVAVVVPAIFVTLVVGYLALHDQRAHEIREEMGQRIAAARAQAELISAVPGDGRGGFPSIEPKHGEPYTAITMSNRSATPVYNVIVSLVLVQGAGPRRANEFDEEEKSMYQQDFSTLPPGEYEARVSGGWAGMMARPGIEIAFRDSGGRSWARYATGQLVRLPKEPVAYYHLDEPIGWEIPRAVR
jgi:hypothetical protein